MTTKNAVGNSLTGSTGSGSFVGATSPTLVTPVLGTPSSGTLTNCTGLPVAGGGTGVASTTAYAVLCGGTTSTGALQSIAGVGSSGEILTSNGAGALPTFQAATAAAAQSDQETGTSTTTFVSPGRQQYHASAAKAWLYSLYSAGVPQVTASYNITSITDSGTGSATVVIATDFSSTSYCVASSVNSANNGAIGFINPYSLAAGQFIASLTNFAGTPTDVYAFHVACYGDQ